MPLCSPLTGRLASVLLLLLATAGGAAGAPEPDAVRGVMRRAFDWQVAHPWSAQHPLDHHHGNRGWVQAAFLVGVMEAWRDTGDTAYRDYAQRTAEANGWQLGARTRHADDHAVGQTYLELYELAPAPEKIAPTQAVLDQVLASPTAGRALWWWCDALFMSPPTFAKLTHATGDPRYLEAMDRWFWDSYLALYDPAEDLFYRDQRFVFPRDSRKVFWSRGNGWVLAGLARLLDILPADHPSRPRYIAVFQAMAARLVALQPADGLWQSDLLHPSDQHGEVSGSAFFCYALAWGLNHGLLTAASVSPAVDRTWSALAACVDAEGRVGWVQPIGFAPGAYTAETWQEYGTGAFLAAGAQRLRRRVSAPASAADAH